MKPIIFTLEKFMWACESFEFEDINAGFLEESFCRRTFSEESFCRIN
jgi:hypothetical protein